MNFPSPSVSYKLLSATYQLAVSWLVNTYYYLLHGIFFLSAICNVIFFSFCGLYLCFEPTFRQKPLVNGTKWVKNTMVEDLILPSTTLSHRTQTHIPDWLGLAVSCWLSSPWSSPLRWCRLWRVRRKSPDWSPRLSRSRVQGWARRKSGHSLCWKVRYAQAHCFYGPGSQINFVRTFNFAMSIPDEGWLPTSVYKYSGVPVPVRGFGLRWNYLSLDFVQTSCKRWKVILVYQISFDYQFYK